MTPQSLRAFVPIPEQEPILAVIASPLTLPPKLSRRLRKSGFMVLTDTAQPCLTAPTRLAFETAIRKAARRRIDIDLTDW